jgi:transcription initiation factor TFIIIB Brf1 subunit/transcription initiation factor TFIIB
MLRCLRKIDIELRSIQTTLLRLKELSKKLEMPRQNPRTNETLHYKEENEHKFIQTERMEITAAKLCLNTHTNVIKRQTIMFV